MRSGRLRARVTFQTELRADDGGGGSAQGTWRTFAKCRGEYLPERGREQIAAGHLQGSNLGVLRVRWSSLLATLTTQARCLINDDPVTFQIRSIINPDQRNQMLELTVERGTAPYS